MAISYYSQVLNVIKMLLLTFQRPTVTLLSQWTFSHPIHFQKPTRLTIIQSLKALLVTFISSTPLAPPTLTWWSTLKPVEPLLRIDLMTVHNTSSLIMGKSLDKPIRKSACAIKVICQTYAKNI